MTAARVGRLLLGLPLFAAATLAEAPPLPDNPLAGRLLFESRSCVLCHSLAGDEAGVGPGLGRGAAFSSSFLDLGADLWNHVPGMAVSLDDAHLGWPELTPGEVSELTAFIYFIAYLGRPGDAASGRRLFDGKGCAVCHEAGGGRRGAPDLAELRRFASPLYIAQAIWNHGPEMLESIGLAGMRAPGFAEGDLADLSAFLRQAAAAGPQERVLVAPGNPNRGGELFRSRGCPLCHGQDARGGQGPDLTRADLHRSAEAIAGTMWNHAPEMRDAMRARGLAWPRFTTAELADLVAYLYFLPFADPPGDAGRGRRVFASRSCSECHGGGESPHEGPDLAGSGVTASPADFVSALWNHAPLMKEAILGEGRPWPELTGDDLRDLLAYLAEP